MSSIVCSESALNEKEFFDERAGILQFEAGMARVDAEMQARIETEKWVKAKQSAQEIQPSGRPQT